MSATPAPREPRQGGQVLLPLPQDGFDVTEVALAWKGLTAAGHQVTFATAAGAAPATADQRLLEGVLTSRPRGLLARLNPKPETLEAYAEMTRTPEYQHPVAWGELEPRYFDGLYLPGGHAPPMRPYLSDEVLQNKAAAFMAVGLPVAAICHGPLVLARARDAKGQSVLRDRQVTCLPKFRERTAYLITAWKLGRYYRTYPAYVEDEVKAQLRNPSAQFERGPFDLFSGAAEERHPFVVEDGNLVTGRQPGDTRALTERFAQKVSEQVARANAAR